VALKFANKDIQDRQAGKLATRNLFEKAVAKALELVFPTNQWKCLNRGNWDRG